MLVLSRKEGERIKLGEDVVLTIVRLSGDNVRVGIDAPAEMVVLRDELKAFATPPDPGAAPSGT
ncbi:MAG: carbon storage regulator [Planctomycetaceae bacterium]|mgnify:FL=1|nr:carbon storage regulator [Planctomycetaceae bacterium]